jgi:hypothetical protein
MKKDRLPSTEKITYKINIIEKNRNYLVFDNEHNVDFL